MGTSTAPAPGPNDAPPKQLPLGVKLQYAYLVRVPILVGITLFALPIVSLFALRQLLGNLFLLGPWNILWTMIATTTLAFAEKQPDQLSMESATFPSVGERGAG